MAKTPPQKKRTTKKSQRRADGRPPIIYLEELRKKISFLAEHDKVFQQVLVALLPSNYGFNKRQKYFIQRVKMRMLSGKITKAAYMRMAFRLGVREVVQNPAVSFENYRLRQKELALIK